MINVDKVPTLNAFSYAHELLLSLNVSFAIVSVVELEAHRVVALFFSLEFSIHRLLHIQETDLLKGYIAFSTSSIALALCIWLILRLSAGTKVTKGILRHFAGIVVLALPAAFWAYLYQKYGWPFGWPYRWAPFELALATMCAWLYSTGRWRFPVWFGALLLAGHYMYWFWIAGDGNYFTSNYTGPVAPALGFCSAMAWAAYVARLRQR